MLNVISSLHEYVQKTAGSWQRLAREILHLVPPLKLLDYLRPSVRGTQLPQSAAIAFRVRAKGSTMNISRSVNPSTLDRLTSGIRPGTGCVQSHEPSDLILL